MKVISVLNYKGGVGKTTFTACVSQALALNGFRVLTVDNDSQHNLSTMFNAEVKRPNIRDVYNSDIGPASQKLLHSIQETSIKGLHIITSDNNLSNSDIQDEYLLQKCFRYTKLERFYDVILIDNATGIDTLQLSSIHCSDEIFVPTELKQFSLGGIKNMQMFLERKYPDDCKISRIIPLFYRSIKSQNSNLEIIKESYPGMVTQTAIPYDNVFDELVAENKCLFLHRLYSKGAAYYMKIIYELFDIDEIRVWENLLEQRNRQRRIEARERFYKRQMQEQHGQQTGETEERNESWNTR